MHAKRERNQKMMERHGLQKVSALTSSEKSHHKPPCSRSKPPTNVTVIRLQKRKSSQLAGMSSDDVGLDENRK